MAIVSQKIEYRDGETALAGFLFHQAAVQTRRPGLLLVHHAYGLDDHAKNHASAYAELGMVVFVCDMLGPGVAGNPETTRALLAQLRNDRVALLSRVGAGLEVLKAQADVDGRLAAIGYCFGGMTVLQMARAGLDLTGVASVHGSLATSIPATAGAIKAKVLALHGALDPHVPMAHVTAFVDEMKQAGADWQLTIYGGAMHGFTYQGATNSPGVAYNAEADARSMDATKDFFAELFAETGSEAA